MTRKAHPDRRPDVNRDLTTDEGLMVGSDGAHARRVPKEVRRCGPGGLGGSLLASSSGGGAGEFPARGADMQLGDLVSAEYGRSSREPDHHPARR
jgi:hypothetical protein